MASNDVKSRYYRLCLAAFLLTVGTVAGALGQEPVQKPDGRLFLFKVSSADASLSLLGSVHIARSSMYPLASEIETAYRNADCLVVEALDPDPITMQATIIAVGMYPTNDSLVAHLSPKTRAAFETYAVENAPSATSLRQLRPWLAAAAIQVQELQQAGFDVNQGIDRHFLASARADGKRVGELESFDSQIAMMSGFPDSLQDTMLFHALNSASGPVIQRICDLWLQGDTEAMERLIFNGVDRHPEYRTMYQAMFYDRNVGMADKVEVYLKHKTSCLVVVGAGHLVGPKSVLQLLKNRGYQVEQQHTLAKGEQPSIPPEPAPEPIPTNPEQMQWGSILRLMTPGRLGSLGHHEPHLDHFLTFTR